MSKMILYVKVYVKDESKSDYSLYFKEKVNYFLLLPTTSITTLYFHFIGDIVGIYSSELYNDWIDICFCVL